MGNVNLIVQWLDVIADAQIPGEGKKNSLIIQPIGCIMENMKSRDLIDLLKKNGWVLDRIQGSHHIFIKSGQPKSLSVPVHKGKDIKTGTARKILKDADILGDKT